MNRALLALLFAAKMKAANQTSFATAAEADKAGYKACKVCKP